MMSFSRIAMYEEDNLDFHYSPQRGRSPPASPFHSSPSPTGPPSSDASAVGEANTVDTSSSEDSVSDGSESNFEGCNVVLPYQCDPSFKNREDLEQFLKGCDNRIESNSDSEDENVDLEGWKDIKKDCTCGRCGDITSNGFEHQQLGLNSQNREEITLDLFSRRSHSMCVNSVYVPDQL